MAPYLILLFVPLLQLIPLNIVRYGSNPLREKQRAQRGRRVLISFFLLYYLLLCLKSSELGADAQQYQYHFRMISKLGWKQLLRYEYEIGFVILNKLVSTVTDNFHIMEVVVASLSLFPLAKRYCEDVSHPYLKIILFVNSSYFASYFSGGRQLLAAAIIFSAFSFVRERKLVPFLIAVFLASLFHQSAWFALLLYPCYAIRVKKQHLPLLLGSAVIIFVFRKELFTVLVRFSSDKFITRYSSVSNTGAFLMLIFYVLLCVFCIVTTDTKSRDRDTAGILNYLYLATIIQMFASIAHGITRINDYFIAFIPILLPKIMDSALPRFKQVAWLANLVICVFFTIYFIMNTRWGSDIVNIFPYQAFWQSGT
ncbi:MAG: EpsG family protein [Oscillospiraceae bacterium]|nr:EpsG family protein [Oscillospiraceae bacterium]